MVNQVPVVTVQSLGQIQTGTGIGTPVRPIMETTSVNQNVQSNPQDIQNQGIYPFEAFFRRLPF
mgnify:CR=1 FL=1